MKHFAFTLAEVLITLGIIGVVAAMTLPALVQNYKEQETVTRVKKFYSVFSQAYAQAILDNGTIDNWGFQILHLKKMMKKIAFIQRMPLHRVINLFP